MSAGNPLERKKNRQEEGNSPRQKKTAVLLLSLFAVLVIGLSVWKFYAALRSPFEVDGEEKSQKTGDTYSDSDKIDSDNDGISNADEINVYKTSPYLPDSDSDGISDYDEINAGTDPNCPTGKVCATSDTTVNSGSDFTNDIADDLTTDNSQSATTVSEITPDFLRQILIQNGSETSTVNQISDEDIMAAYQEAVQSQASSTNQ